MKKTSKYRYDVLYTELREEVEHLLFETEAGRTSIKSFSRLEEFLQPAHDEFTVKSFHDLLCEIYNDLFRENLIIVDPGRGFQYFTISPRCLKRYQKRHLRPRQSAYHDI